MHQNSNTKHLMPCRSVFIDNKCSSFPAVLAMVVPTVIYLDRLKCNVT